MTKLEKLTAQGHGFAVYPEVRILKEPGGKAIQHLMFGDYITPPKNSSGNGYLKWGKSKTKEVGGKTWIQVRSRQEEGWIQINEIQLERILEVNFIDVGQGDGCHLATPSEEHYIIDAGKKDNMYRFLRWRFNLSSDGKQLPKFDAIISHPDEDHYKGFVPLLSEVPPTLKRKIKFDSVYYNGIIQRPGSTIGEKKKIDGHDYLVDVIEDEAALRNQLDEAVTNDKISNFQELLLGTISASPGISFSFLHAKPSRKTYLCEKGDFKIRVLAPVTETKEDHTVLRWFGSGTDIGKTKNGHSIVLLATIGKMRVLLGGDLNSPSADFLMEQYSGVNLAILRKKLKHATKAERTKIEKQIDSAVENFRKNFKSDVAKSCHHGSHDITNEFLKGIHPIATIISSGDEESFCHPRPETLGAIGRFSRGDRPLIYSTELARSSPEYINIVKKDLKTDKIKQKIVSVYGMISLRTDGQKAIIAQKLEKNRSTIGKGITKWQFDKLVWDETMKDFITG